jgi:hypothetical protein
MHFRASSPHQLALVRPEPGTEFQFHGLPGFGAGALVWKNPSLSY